jgi:hypothetical protein
MITAIFCIFILVNSVHNKPWDSNEVDIDTPEPPHLPNISNNTDNCIVVVDNGVYFNNCTSKNPTIRLIT